VCCCFSDDNNEVVGGYDDGSIRAFDLESRRQKWMIAGHKGCVTSLYVDKMYVLSGGSDGIVRVWSRNNRQLIIQVPAHTKAVTGVFPDLKKNHIIHSCSVDKSVFTFDLKAEKKVIMH
jgi:WD40 repeat protein